MRKAYGYIRVSGKGQVAGNGFTRQEKAGNTTGSAANSTTRRNSANTNKTYKTAVYKDS